MRRNCAGRKARFPARSVLLFSMLWRGGVLCARARLRHGLASGLWRYLGTARTVDNFVARLRAHIGDDAETPRHLETVRGIGYRFNT